MATSTKKRRIEGDSGSTSSKDSGSSLPDENKIILDEGETVDEDVIVTDRATGRTLEIPLSEDGTLAFSTLEHNFPGAYGLEYPKPNSNVKRGVKFNDNKKVFETPSVGWKGKKFEVIYRGKKPGTPYDEVQEGSRLSTGSACPVKKFGKDNRDLPTSEYVNDFCFYIQGDGIKDCVVCLEADFFCTFRHGTHKNYKLREVLIIYNYDGKKSMVATVRYINERLDFIILKTTQKVEKVPFLALKFFSGEDLLICGRSDESGELTYAKGCIRTSLLQYYDEQGPFIVATIHSLPGDSGAAVFSANGLIGMNLGVAEFNYQPYEDMILRAAHFSVFNYMVGAWDLRHGINMVKHEDSPPKPGSRQAPLRLKPDSV